MKQQYHAAVRRITELEEEQQSLKQAACQHELALSQKDAELVTARHSVRSVAVDHMRQAPPSKLSCSLHQTIFNEMLSMASVAVLRLRLVESCKVSIQVQCINKQQLDAQAKHFKEERTKQPQAKVVFLMICCRCKSGGQV